MTKIWIFMIVKCIHNFKFGLYDFIREKLIKKGFSALTGKDGKWIQARTKGTGGINPRTGKRRPITRAFYARTSLVKKIFETAS
jgi:hypothetical protein